MIIRQNWEGEKNLLSQENNKILQSLNNFKFETECENKNKKKFEDEKEICLIKSDPKTVRNATSTFFKKSKRTGINKPT